MKINDPVIWVMYWLVMRPLSYVGMAWEFLRGKLR